MHPALVWLTLFVWTLALELPVYAALLRHQLRDARQAGVLVLAVNLLTHPALFLLDLPSDIALIEAEVVVAVTEGVGVALWLGKPAIVRAQVASFGANLLSTAAGLALGAWLAR